MSQYGISGGDLPLTLPYAKSIQEAADDANFSPRFTYAIAWRETIRAQMSGWIIATYGAGITAANCVSGDGGHGVFQLTSYVPPHWDDPYSNALCAIKNWFTGGPQPSMQYWVARGMVGNDLIRCMAASFNCGIDQAQAGHDRGNVDMNTANGDYGADVLEQYLRLNAALMPQMGFAAELSLHG